MSSNLNDIKKAAEEKLKSIEKSDVLPAYVARESDNSGIDARIISHHNPKSSICEHYRVIFTHLKNELAKENSKLVALTSAQRNEGKSISLLNLAVVIARDFKKKVLVIDSNLRRPVIDELMNLKVNGGLTDILSKGINYRELIQSGRIPNLSFITAGKEIHNPVELLHSSKLKDFLEKTKLEFDYVLCDTSAIIPYADTKILSPLLDGVIITIKARKTRREVVDRTEGILRELHSKVFGFILTDVEYYIPEFIYKYL
jgi:capsular exopolysaccharide synthesis family protein